MPLDVEKVARLAYLKLSADEKTLFVHQFKKIMEYVNQLNEVEMTDLEAQSMNSFHIQTAFYEMFEIDPNHNLRDEPSDASQERLVLNNSEALHNSPKSSGLPHELLYEVPSIIER
jgi:aspartyl/glutamyl-tRNA(Asn/Gln) amidotransferase C subunit